MRCPVHLNPAVRLDPSGDGLVLDRARPNHWTTATDGFALCAASRASAGSAWDRGPQMAACRPGVVRPWNLDRAANHSSVLFVWRKQAADVEHDEIAPTSYPRRGPCLLHAS